MIHVPREDQQEDVHTIQKEFAEHGIYTILVTKDNSLGINAVKDRLKVVRTQDGTIKRPPKMYVFEDCAGVLWEFGRYACDSYVSDGLQDRREMINRPMKKDDHYMDIIKYECLKLLGESALSGEKEEDNWEAEQFYGEIGY